MNNNRVAMLVRMREEQPDDPFIPFALGMEFIMSNRPQALHYFEETKRLFPEYLPVYYQLALLSLEREQTEEAKQYLNEGIAIATRQGEVKTLNELKALLGQIDWED
jgi:tetratricopeptide (TPR) repeat protein